jgi:MinD superfamily P-loop ATPase
LCPTGAISEKDRSIGVIKKGRAANGIEFISGTLNVGESTVPPLIEKVLDEAKPDILQIIDAPPGAACPTIACIKAADFVIMVTEPTAFGLHDLRAAVEIALNFNKPIGVVINRYHKPFDELEEFLKEKRIPVLASIPMDKDIARVYSNGNILLRSLPAYRKKFIDINTAIERIMDRQGG